MSGDLLEKYLHDLSDKALIGNFKNAILGRWEGWDEDDSEKEDEYEAEILRRMKEAHSERN